MGFIWGQKVRGSVRKGRKSSNLFFRNPRKPSHVEFCSESFFIEIPQLSIITELSMPITFFIFVLSWRQTTQKTSKNERGRRAVTACYLLETDVSLFFCQNHTPSIIFEGKTSRCEVSKIFGCCGFLCLQFLSDHISSTHGKSQGKSVWGPLFIHLLASYSRADWQQVFTCQRFAIFFAASKNLDWVKWMDRVVG